MIALLHARTFGNEAMTRALLVQEAQGLWVRLGRMEPLGLVETAVPAAAFPLPILRLLEEHLACTRARLARQIEAFLAWLRRGPGRIAPLAEAQQRMSLLRMRFVMGLEDYDIFSDALTQRSERKNGVWLAGLDVVAHDSLCLPGDHYPVPPLVCYLDRGRGAAIRRMRTRLPGGGTNPVAIIRVPRERMLGTAVASSLVHEAGHQGSALLKLVPSVSPLLSALRRKPGRERQAWALFDRWMGEIAADLWSVARLGATATVGLMGILAFPRPFLFRITPGDPHPCPYLRVLLSAAFGDALYPHTLWRRLAQSWRSTYPLSGLPSKLVDVLETLSALIPTLTSLVLEHRPSSLRGDTVAAALSSPDRAPEALLKAFHAAGTNGLRGLKPTLALAALGQARMAGQLHTLREAELIDDCLTAWALYRLGPLSPMSLADLQRNAQAQPDLFGFGLPGRG